MITHTSLTHPTALRSIRNAAFHAALDCSAADTHYLGSDGSRHGVSYALNRKGSSFMRADVLIPVGNELCKLRFYAAGGGNHNYIWEVADAMGAAGFTYLHRLCDALARPAVEKIW